MNRTAIKVVLILVLTGCALLFFRSWLVRRVLVRTRSQAMIDAIEASSDQRATHPAAALRASCRQSDLVMRIPFGGVANRDWVIANYVDLDPAIGQTRDYTGATGDSALTYDGHTGLDIEVPSFRAMDRDFPVLASVDGMVEEYWDQSTDRNRTCSSDKWNYVKIRARNGFAVLEGHLKKNSVRVRPGQRVRAGQEIAVVGSSGCSSYPHVHLELLDCLSQVIDVMQAGLLQPVPKYSRQVPATVMEVTVFQPPIDSFFSIQDPGPNELAAVSVGSKMSVGVTVANLKAQDVVQIDFLTPDHSPSEFSFTQKADRYLTRSHWWGDFQLTTQGVWTARVKINGEVQTEQPITVTP